jgi:putative transposase
MKVRKAIKFKIHPTVKQRKLLAKHFGCCRWVYNYFLQYKTDQYKKTKKSASWLEMNKLLTELKKQPDKQWLNEVSRVALNCSLENLDSAFNNFFRKTVDYPKFKNKHSKQSYRLTNQHFYVVTDGIRISKVGILKCEINLPKEYELLSITISKTPTNKYYASISYETEIPNPKVDKTKPVIGLDFGLKTFITTSVGEKIDHPLPYKKSLRKLRRSQRKLSRRKKGSKRREIQRLRIALIHEKITNQRRDFLHKLSSRLVDENQAIYLEDLSLRGMKARWGRKISDLGWRMFTDFLSYKGKWEGCLVEKRDRLFPSSKLCSVCGKINSSLTLSDRVWTCSGCGSIHDRDWNAAKNVLNYGPVTRKQRTGRVEVLDSLVELSRQE